LRRDHGVELPAVRGEHVDRGDRRGDLALVEIAPGLVFADRQLHLEAVILEEDGVLGRIEPAVGGDQPGIARVLADLDRDDVVLDRHRRWRCERRHRHLDVDDRRTFGVGLAGGVAATAPQQHVAAERDQPADQDDRQQPAEEGKAWTLRVGGHRSGPISLIAGVAAAWPGALA
jgi:hypothetical protein